MPPRSKFAVPLTVQTYATEQTGQSSISPEGLPMESWEPTTTTFYGVISTSPQAPVDQYGQIQYTVEYSIVTWGPPYPGAKANDRLVDNKGRVYYLYMVEQPANQDRVTIYHARTMPSVS